MAKAGETRKLNNKLAREKSVRYNKAGLKMVLEEYIDTSNVIVRFEKDNTKVKTSWRQFKDGYVTNPNTPYTTSKQVSRLGTTNTNTDGLKMTVTAYRSSMDLDVTFDDNPDDDKKTVVTNRSWRDFINGNIKNSNFSREGNYLGRKVLCISGLWAEIIEYVNWKNLTVKYEENTVVKINSLSHFTEGKIIHPFFDPRSNNNFLRVGEYMVKGLAYIHDNKGEFYCYKGDDKDNIEIKNIDEMKADSKRFDIPSGIKAPDGNYYPSLKALCKKYGKALPTVTYRYNTGKSIEECLK